MTPFALAVPEDIAQLRISRMNATEIYKQYYLKYKQHLLTYTRREIPEWILAAGLGTWKEAKFLK